MTWNNLLCNAQLGIDRAKTPEARSRQAVHAQHSMNLPGVRHVSTYSTCDTSDCNASSISIGFIARWKSVPAVTAMPSTQSRVFEFQPSDELAPGVTRHWQCLPSSPGTLSGRCWILHLDDSSAYGHRRSQSCRTSYGTVLRLGHVTVLMSPATRCHPHHASTPQEQ